MKQAITLTKETKKLKSGTVKYWALRWHGRDGKHHSKSLGRTDQVSKRQAMKRRREMLNEFDLAPGRRNAKRAMTLGQYLKRYFDVNSHRLAASTVASYDIAGRYFMGFFGKNEPIDRITRADASRFKAALAAGKLDHVCKGRGSPGPQSVNRVMRSLKAMFGMAVRDDMLVFNPLDRTVTNIKKSADWHYVSGDEFKKITEAASPKLRVAISLCRLAGLRREEALRLEWCNVDWGKSRIAVVGKSDWQPKARKARIIPMCPELQSLLLDAYEVAPQGQGRVLYNVYGGNLTRDVKAAVERAGVVVYSKPLHTLRKSCITDWAGQYPMHVVKEWAGHANIATTQQFYLKVLDSDYERAATSSFWKKVTENCTENAKNDSSGQPGTINKETQTTD